MRDRAYDAVLVQVPVLLKLLLQVHADLGLGPQHGDDHVEACFALQLTAPQAYARGALHQRLALNGSHQQNKAMRPASQTGNDVLE